MLPLITLAARVVELLTQHLVQLLESRNFSLKRSVKRRCVLLLLTIAVVLLWLRRVDAEQFSRLKPPLAVLVLVGTDFALSDCGSKRV